MPTYINKLYRIITAVRKDANWEDRAWTEVVAENVNDPSDRIECLREPDAKPGDLFAVAEQIAPDEVR